MLSILAWHPGLSRSYVWQWVPCRSTSAAKRLKMKSRPGLRRQVPPYRLACWVHPGLTCRDISHYYLGTGGGREPDRGTRPPTHPLRRPSTNLTTTSTLLACQVRSPVDLHLLTRLSALNFGTLPLYLYMPGAAKCSFSHIPRDERPVTPV